MVSRGEVWWYEDPRAGRRPFLILTRDEAIPLLTQILGVPVTRTIRGIPTEVVIDEGDGMPTCCCLTLDNIMPIRASLCTDLIASLGEERMREVCGALSAASACS